MTMAMHLLPAEHFSLKLFRIGRMSQYRLYLKSVKKGAKETVITHY